MKILKYSLSIAFIISYGSIAGPADTTLTNVKIENTANIENSSFRAHGFNQKLKVGSTVIKQGTKLKNANLKHQADIENVRVDMKGGNQKIEVGTLEVK